MITHTVHVLSHLLVLCVRVKIPVAQFVLAGDGTHHGSGTQFWSNMMRCWEQDELRILRETMNVHCSWMWEGGMLWQDWTCWGNGVP